MADTKVSLATAIPLPHLDDVTSWVDTGATTKYKIPADILGGFLFHGVPQFRLSLESGVPNSTTDQLAKGTLYYTPCTPSGQVLSSGFLRTYNGTTARLQESAEVSLALTLTSGKNYDVFIKNSDLSLVLSTAWTTDIARADALTSVKDLEVANADNTFLWIGTIRAVGTNQTEDSGGLAGTTQVGARRYVWNTYNQLIRPMRAVDKTDSWTYGSTTIRQAQGNARNGCEVVMGVAGGILDASLIVTALAATGVNTPAIGIGFNDTAAFSGVNGQLTPVLAADSMYGPLTARFSGPARLGYNALSWNEVSITGTSTFLGDNAAAFIQSGMNGFSVC